MKLEYLKLDIIEEEARKLPFSHRIAFAASICERLLPNYNIFSREEDWGNYSLLRTALDEIWLFTQGKPFDEVGLRQLIIDCENAIPHDHNNHYSSYVSEAQNAAISVCNALELCLKSNQKLVSRVARCAHNTLWEYLDWQINESSNDWEEKPFEERETIITNHRFAVREMEKENEDLQRLKETPILTKEFLQWLRTSCKNDGKSLIDLS